MSAEPKKLESHNLLVHSVAEAAGSRRPFPSSVLAKTPFQLLPFQLHSAADLEGALIWQQNFISDLDEVPTFSVLTPLEGDLEQLLESCAVQSHLPKEVVILDYRDKLEGELPQYPFNIKVLKSALPRSLALGEALNYVEGDYVALLEDEHLLHPEALFISAKQIMRGDIDLIYGNELSLSDDGSSAVSFSRRDTLSRYSVLGSNTVGDALILKRKLAEELFKTTQGLESRSEVWAISAQALLKGSRNMHVPLGIFARRGETSSKSAGFLTHYAKEAEIPLAEVSSGHAFRVSPAKSEGKIQVVIPFRDQVEITIKAIASLLKQDALADIELCLVDNNSTEESRGRLDEFVKSSEIAARTKIVDDKGYFNFARLNNRGCSLSGSDYILFLNNDVEIEGSGAVAELRNWCAGSDVAVVGGELRYPDGSIQSAGINFAAVRPMNVTDPSFGSGRLREVDGVSFAMAMVKRSAFEEAHGLDELLCPNGFGDAIFCQKLRERGWTVLATPNAVATHHESLSRGSKPEDLELLEMVDGGVFIADLYEDFSVERQPRIIPLSGQGVKGFLRKYPRLRNVARRIVRGFR